MSNIESLTIGEARELAALFGNHQAPKPAQNMGLQIVVADRGFVYVGQTVVNGDMVTITDARNIRKWGTTKGIGQLALSGPTNDTVLDAAGEVVVPLKAVIHFIKCKTNW